MNSQTVIAAEHNVLLPATYDIVWSTVCLVIIGLVFWKKVLPLFQKVLAERTEKIEGGIAKAEAAQAEAQRTLEQYRAQLAEARAEAARIRDDARAEGQRIVDEMREQAQAEANRIVAQGQAQLAAQKAQIVAELRADLGRVAVDLAGRVVGESLEDEARRRGTVDRFLDELDAVSAPAAK
ncbi:ATP synthase F0 subcomplex B subunit [Streptoalloteichus tenebrarius]|uniref:ATP synthase subunit b n=1 Tax=Streptoalloteichus tenebrarius (strain ATCC 17920 / DSM 40477 / JCM 4838 / CBS 697.72 / NBRC 16177 / NCIMB 11028 / NRRL B-12390 / A12253. 1 / ISP 5477) TaxID=1933 RepID=A0ABT1HXP7_STRSD|nr:F0F1 ATP synthase subunit B [Streptoalloteichus tenebrarius]MCP2260298.1 ATP synthase F0 subcomplex B subunit [Streptoalloteichus tenebrarius]